MVSFDRVKRKLPSLLIDENTTSVKGHPERNRIAYRIQRLRLRKRDKYDSLNAKLFKALQEYEGAVSGT